MNDLLDFLYDTLTADELELLQRINRTENSEDRQLHLKSFFHNSQVFEKIKEKFDPTWASYTIFIQGRDYEI